MPFPSRELFRLMFLYKVCSGVFINGNIVRSQKIGLHFVASLHVQGNGARTTNRHVAIDAIVAQNDVFLHVNRALWTGVPVMARHAFLREIGRHFHLAPVYVVASGAIHVYRVDVTLAGSEQPNLIGVHIERVALL